MARRGHDLSGRPLLDDTTLLHHQHPVADGADDAEVVGDEEVGQAQVAAEIGQQLQDLCADRDPLANALRTMLYALQAAGDRHDRTGVMKLSEAEIASMKVAAAAMDKALEKIPVNVYKGAVRIAALQQAEMHTAKMAHAAQLAEATA